MKISSDVDLYPLRGYDERNVVYEELMREVGFDSEFYEAGGFNIEAVAPKLARFPEDWMLRSIRESFGEIEIGELEKRDEIAIFPEIRDLTVAKLAIGREKDLRFLEGVVWLGLVDEQTLVERYRQAPRLTQDRLLAGLVTISDTFSRNADESAAAAANEPADPDRKVSGAGLSESENAVKRLVALGCTNREIAERTSIPKKTGEKCMSNIFRKLGLRSRSQVPSYASLHDSGRASG